MQRRRDRGRAGAAFLGSVALHAAAVVLLWVTARAAPLPEMRVYAVEIISPPPQAAGEPEPEPAVEPAEDEPDPAEEEPETESEPEPTPPEPSPPTQTTRTEPEQPRPKRPEPAREEPEREQPRREEANTSTGRDPDPTSAGGENLDVRIEGARFVDPDYLANIQRQLYRYFRPPQGARTDEAEVFFRINRDGSVAGIRLVTSSGSVRFRLAAVEAVERAGGDRAFGPLPDAYPADQLPVSFYFRPAGRNR